MHLSQRGRSPITRLAAGFAATALGVGLSLTGTPPAQAAGSSFCSDGTQPYASVADVEAFAAGTAVTGLSVTSGTTPSPFTGTYIGYIADALGKNKDLLLFRLHSDVIDGTGSDALKPAGIWAGMSGSPVYTTDGRLIGAIAYSLNADNLPVAGVTPAEYMRSIGTTALGTAARVKVTSSNLNVSAEGAKVAGTSLTGASLSQVKTVNVAGPAGARANAFTNRVLARTPKSAKASSFLRSRSFLPAAAERSISAPLVAGGSIAALYTSGDLTLGAIGTVTAVCGDSVYAFGHPMNFLGRTSLGMANASTALIVPDATGSLGSYKQVSVIGTPIGMVTQDRSVGIRGTIGAVTSYGIDVEVRDASGTPVGSYHADVAFPDAGPSSVADLAGQAAYEQLDADWGGTGKVDWTIGFTRADGTAQSLSNTQAVADPEWFPEVAGDYPAEDLYAISSNPFEDVTITHVAVTITLLSADSLTYEPSGVQLKRSSGEWSSLDGVTLKAGRTYSVRPEYTLVKNGKPTATTSTGEPISVKLSKKARKAGWFSVSPASDGANLCDPDTDVCDDISDEGGYFSFDDLLSSLQDAQSASGVVGELHYRLTRGSSDRSYSWDGPGVVTGATEADFSIRK